MNAVREGAIPISLAVITFLGAVLAVGAPLPPIEVGTDASATPTENVALEEGTYHSIVIFRNDDVQPYYKNEELRAVNDVFVEENVPVTLGVIPAPGNRSLASDSEFCRYLRDLDRTHPGLFEFSLHGTTHQEETDFYGRSEFGGLPYAAQRDRIARGARVLEACTGVRPTTFVPPFNTYDENTIAALDERGIHTVSGGAWFTEAYYDRSDSFRTGDALHVPSSHSFVANWSTNEFHDNATLRRSFDAAYENRSLYVQMLHYPTFTDDTKLAQLRSLIRYMKSREDVGFLTLADFARAVRSGALERTADGWRYRTDGAGNGSNGTTIGDRPARVVVAPLDSDSGPAFVRRHLSPPEGGDRS